MSSPFLPVEARDHRHQRNIVALRQTGARLQGALVRQPLIEMIDIKGLRQMLIGLRIPFGVIEAVENAVHVEAAMTQQFVHARAAFRRHDLARVGRADGVDERGVIDAARHEIDFAVAFFQVQAVRQQAEIVKDIPARSCPGA